MPRSTHMGEAYTTNVTRRVEMPLEDRDPQSLPQAEHPPNRLLLPRPRLLQRIQRALQHSHVLIIAPAGYGKSTLMRALIALLPESYFLPLTPADADLSVFQERLDAVSSRAAVIVLDDVHHLAEAQDVIAWLGNRLYNTTPRWVLGGRMVPPPLVASHHEAIPHFVLDSDDLVFRLGECRALLHTLDEALAAQWHERTQGWPLALSMLAGQSTNSIEPEAAMATNEALFAYLAQSIFAKLPIELLAFITRSALPLRFNNELLAELLEWSVDAVAAMRVEVQRRNLFLEATEEKGWFKYHEVVRQYLCSLVEYDQRIGVATRLVAHFETENNLRMAVEHALDGGLYEHAARLMDAHGGTMLLDLGWLQSYQRWLTSIPEAILAQSPMILAHLGFALVYQRQFIDEGLRYLYRAQFLASAQSELVVKEVGLRLASAYYLIGKPEEALPLLLTAMSYQGFSLRSQIRTRLYLAPVYARLNRLRDARLVYQDAAKLLEKMENQEGKDSLIGVLRHNQGTGIESVRGDFVQFEKTLHLSLKADAGKPAALEMDYVGFCIMHENVGDWDALAADLQQIKATRLQQMGKTPDASNHYEMTAKWEMFYWATLYVGRREAAAAQSMTEQFIAAVTDSEAIACGQWLQAWNLRTQQRYAECIAFVDSLAPALEEAARFYRAALAVERAAAALLAGRADWASDILTHLRFHMQIGAKHYLLRWRLLLTLACHQRHSQCDREDNVRKAVWRKHVNFVLCSLKRYDYARLLIQREPVLAAHFWALCLMEDIQVDIALTALKEIGQIEPIFMLLDAQSQAKGDNTTGGRSAFDRKAQGEREIRLLQGLVAIGDEKAIPLLHDRVQAETRKPVVDTMMTSLDQLEAIAPPTLHVTLLGRFGLRRGAAMIGEDAWQRPTVRQLFHYFCLHHGSRLPRSQILQDLWPANDTQSALAAFRTSFSRLGKVLEPHLRKRTANRYFEVVDDCYIFDAHRDLVVIDSERFTQIVEAARKERSPLDETQLRVLVEALGKWNPPLTEFAYASWAIHTIEELTEHYATGCLLVACQLLAVDRLIDATAWAEKVVGATPWNEAGWQTLIQCVARQGHRTMALKLYERAVATLEAELGAPPSTETTQLAERLRHNQPI